jgi:hypothetical protein
MRAAIVEFVSGERRKLQEGCPWVDDSLYTFPCKVLATGAVTFYVLASTTKRSGFKALPQLRNEGKIVRLSLSKVGVCSIDSCRQSVHAEPSHLRDETCT